MLRKELLKGKLEEMEEKINAIIQNKDGSLNPKKLYDFVEVLSKFSVALNQKIEVTKIPKDLVDDAIVHGFLKGLKFCNESFRSLGLEKTIECLRIYRDNELKDQAVRIENLWTLLKDKEDVFEKNMGR